MKYETPLSIYGELFLAMSHSGFWPDDKVIADLEPLYPPEEIKDHYAIAKQKKDFDLASFVHNHFTYQSAGSSYQSNPENTVTQHINALWPHLKREADKHVKGSTLIPLPYPYIVPGGRFNEIYYWDSYFTMLGLKVSGHTDVIENMVNNFAYFIDNLGHIPNGNRTYFISRSQPPFFSLMIQLLASIKGNNTYIRFLPQLEKEYLFWMDGHDKLSPETPAYRRVVLLKNEKILNRYYDDDPTPRAEMYATDVDDAGEYPGSPEDYYRSVKSACESGWDFSCRWFADGQNLNSISTTDIIPLDLNCLLYNLESVIAKAWSISGDQKNAVKWTDLAEQRKESINTTFWSKSSGYYFDYNFQKSQHTGILSLAGIYPLYFNLATLAQAEKVITTIKKHFLKPGGVVTTPYHTGQQWDAPNGWAPLQYIAYIGCKNYGYKDLASEIKNRWINLCTRVYENTGKMMEKYNVENIELLSGGGEYPVQDGFGWSNGVLMYFLSKKS